MKKLFALLILPAIIILFSLNVFATDCTHDAAEEKDNYCSECGEALTGLCEKCGERMREAGEYCPSCGKQSAATSTATETDKSGQAFVGLIIVFGTILLCIAVDWGKMIYGIIVAIIGIGGGLAFLLPLFFS